MPKQRVRSFCFLTFTLFASGAQSSTWIGNGGSVMDTELRSTVSHLKEAVRASTTRDELCTCGGESDQCALLKDLNAQQVKFCAAFIRKAQTELLGIIDSSIQFRFASESVKNAEGSRDFDAVAQIKEKAIIIDEAKFARMNSAGRLQLLAHEFLHFMDYDGKKLEDNGAIGPFTGDRGGREMLDSIGAAYAIVAMQAGAIPTRESSQSRPFRNIFLWYMVGSRSVDDKLQKQSFYDGSSLTSSVLGATWYPRVTDNLGWTLGLNHADDSASSDRGVKSTIKTELVEVGPTYRFVPFERPYWNSVQFTFHLGVGYGSASHVMADDYVRLTGKKSGVGAVANAGVFIPIAGNFWLVAEGGAGYLPYKIESLGIENTSIFTQQYFGVSYAFQF